MDVLEAIRSRRSIRSYLPRPVEEGKLAQLLEVVRLAPSANNRQDCKFIVIRDAALRKKLVDPCNNQNFIAEAPVVIIACTTDAKRMMRSGYQCAAVDVTIAVDHLTLAATSLGLGTCWIGAFDAKKVAAVLQLPPEVTPVHVLPLGYPAENPAPRPRKALAEITQNDV